MHGWWAKAVLRLQGREAPRWHGGPREGQPAAREELLQEAASAGQGDKRRAAVGPGIELGQPSGPGHPGQAGQAARGRASVRTASAPQPRGSRSRLPGPRSKRSPCLVFQNYTQYIPLSVYDLQTWMGSPSIFVYDCSNAGLIVKSFKQFALQREQELEVRLPRAHWAVLRVPGVAAPRAAPSPSLGAASSGVVVVQAEDPREALGAHGWAASSSPFTRCHFKSER